jgi:hypothetical protein
VLMGLARLYLNFPTSRPINSTWSIVSQPKPQ